MVQGSFEEHAHEEDCLQWLQSSQKEPWERCTQMQASWCVQVWCLGHWYHSPLRQKEEAVLLLQAKVSHCGQECKTHLGALQELPKALQELPSAMLLQAGCSGCLHLRLSRGCEAVLPLVQEVLVQRLASLPPQAAPDPQGRERQEDPVSRLEAYLLSVERPNQFWEVKGHHEVQEEDLVDSAPEFAIPSRSWTEEMPGPSSEKAVHKELHSACLREIAAIRSCAEVPSVRSIQEGEEAWSRTPQARSVREVQDSASGFRLPQTLLRTWWMLLARTRGPQEVALEKPPIHD
jgi:hypothetical protein